MRFYGKRSGRNNPSRFVARSFMFYSGKTAKKNNTTNLSETKEKIEQDECKKDKGIYSNPLADLSLIVAAIVDLFICCKFPFYTIYDTVSGFWTLLKGVFFFIPIYIATAIVLTIALLLYDAIFSLVKKIGNDLIKKKEPIKIIIILFLICCVASSIFYVGVHIKTSEQKENEIKTAITNEDFDLAYTLNNDYFLNKDNDKWYSWLCTIDAARKKTLTAAEVLKYYKDDYVKVYVTYGTHYTNGAYDYGIKVFNDSSCDITITKITREINSNSKTLNVNIPVKSKETIETVAETAGDNGAKRKGGSYTMAGNVNGGYAYTVTNFEIEVNK